MPLEYTPRLPPPSTTSTSRFPSARLPAARRAWITAATADTLGVLVTGPRYDRAGADVIVQRPLETVFALRLRENYHGLT
ncbi:hypothetical protein GCM10023319_21180 [Nocardia iowensis]